MASHCFVETGIGRHYLGWDRPFVIELAEWLKRERLSSANRGFDEWLIWVPSSRAGRHLLNELFTGAPEAEEAFHPPRMVTPLRFFQSLLTEPQGVASRVQRLLAWKQVLEGSPTELLAPVFPFLPGSLETGWAFPVARQLMELKEQLAEENHTFADVAKADIPADKDRWVALARMESAFQEVLAERHLTDPDGAMTSRIRDMAGLLPYRRLLVAGVMNLSKRQISGLEELRRAGLPVDFLMPVPSSKSEHFDQWGQPTPSAWLRRPLPASLLEGRLQRAAEPRELIAQILDLSHGYKDNVDALVVGTPEPAIGRFLVERSRSTETPFYAPGGNSLDETAWGRLLTGLDEWQQEGSFTGLSNLLQHSDLRRWVSQAYGPPEAIESALRSLQQDRLLIGVGQLDDPHLSPDSRVAALCGFTDFLSKEGFGEISSNKFPDTVWAWLGRIASRNNLSEGSRAILHQLENLLQGLKDDIGDQSIPVRDYWALLRYLLNTDHAYPDRESQERPVSGWMELPWETAPHLVLLGLPDNQVPGPTAGDSFLTPALCRALGIYGPDERSAFHAFRLRLILECRQSWGRVDIVLPDRGMDDAPMLPSRFLFLAEETEIVNRVDLLLRERTTLEKPAASRFGTRLTLPRKPLPDRLAVTAFRTYLQNPFQFYLRHILGWNPPEPIGKELDARQFGSFAHAVLETFNGDDGGRQLVEDKAISQFLDDTLESLALSWFGSRWSVPLTIQLSSLRERLRAASRVLAEERQAGWFPWLVEWRFHKDVEFSLEGVALRGKVDLVERNEVRGMYRIIDYKTSDNASPAARSHMAHLRSDSPGALLPESDFQMGGKTFRWTDLQLPLYQSALERHTGERAECAYLNLSKAVGDIRLESWLISREEQASALACAEAVIRRAREGHFPLDDRTRYDDPWMEWFGGNYEETLEMGNLQVRSEGES